MQKIDELIKMAMKQKDSTMLTVFRAVKSKIMLEKTGTVPTKLSDEQLFLDMVSKEIKERKEANSYFKDGYHPTVVENLKMITGLEKFLPQKLSEAAQIEMIKSIMSQLNAKSPDDMGKVMAKLSEHKNSLDMKLASTQVKQMLTAV